MISIKFFLITGISYYGIIKQIKNQFYMRETIFYIFFIYYTRETILYIFFTNKTPFAINKYL